MVQRELQHHAVELGRGDARLHMGSYKIQGLGAKPACPAHPIKSVGPMELDLSGVGKRRNGSVNIGHIL